MITTEAKLTLYCDGEEMKSWIYSNNNMIESEAMGCVEEGHRYYIIFNVKTVNSSGKVLDEATIQSDIVTY